MFPETAPSVNLSLLPFVHEQTIQVTSNFNPYKTVPVNHYLKARAISLYEQHPAALRVHTIS
jgi:hypothetical protein